MYNRLKVILNFFFQRTPVAAGHETFVLEVRVEDPETKPSETGKKEK